MKARGLRGMVFDHLHAGTDPALVDLALDVELEEVVLEGNELVPTVA